MKPETRRLIILDVMVGITGALLFFKGVSHWMWLPAMGALLVLLVYGLWLLARMWGDGQLPGEHETGAASVVVRARNSPRKSGPARI